MKSHVTEEFEGALNVKEESAYRIVLLEEVRGEAECQLYKVARDGGSGDRVCGGVPGSCV